MDKEHQIDYGRMPVRVRPYAHQAEAYGFTLDRLTEEDGGGAAILMEMGTGKTLVGVAVTGTLYRMGLIRRVLVVAPLSVLSVWEDEFSRMAAFPFGFTRLVGSIGGKKTQLEKIPSGTLQIVAVNYESAWRLEPELMKLTPDLIIADEGHRIKDSQTRQSRCLHRLGDRARYRMLLTGTLITNREIDVYSEYRFVNRLIFGESFYRFRNRYFDMTGYGNHTPKFRSSMLGEFLTKLHSCAYRVTKEECLDLPDTTEEIRKVTLENDAMDLYRNIEKENFAELAGSEVSAVNILSRLLRLSQITGGHVTDDERTTRTVSRAKLEALSDIIESVTADGGKLVIMARFTAELDDIEDLLDKKHIEHAVIRGSTTDRDDQIFRFQNVRDCRVFVGQIAAAGLGLTLTVSHTMCFYSLDYSMSNFEQSKARIHRVGQKNVCHYIYLIAEQTVDSKVLQSLRDKTDLAHLLIDEWRSGKNPYEP